MTQKLKLYTVATLVGLTMIGCGGGGGSTPSTSGNSTTGGSTTGGTTTGGGNTPTGNTSAVNSIDNIEALKPYLGLANKLVTGAQKTSCLPTGNGKGKVISQVMSGSTIQFAYREYDNAQCTGNETIFDLSYYSLTLGNTINGGKALEANLKFDHGESIIDRVPNHMLGYDIANTVYTTIVASGNESKQEIKLGIAKPTDANDGSSADKRANDVSDYTSGTYYFSN